MFVAVAGVGIHFLHLLEEDGFLRAVVDAGKAELTIAFRLYACGCQFVIATRTYLGADSAADTGICDGKGILAMQQETRFRIYTRCLQESGMLLPFQFRYRRLSGMCLSILICSFISKLGSQLSTIIIVVM